MARDRTWSQKRWIQNCREGDTSEKWSLCVCSTSFTPTSQLSQATEMPTAPCTHITCLEGNCSYTLNRLHLHHHHKILNKESEVCFPFMSCAKASATEGGRDSGECSQRCDRNAFL